MARQWRLLRHAGRDFGVRPLLLRLCTWNLLDPNLRRPAPGLLEGTLECPVAEPNNKPLMD